MFEDGSGEKRNEVDEEGKAWELVVALLGSCREEGSRRMAGILLWSLIISSFIIMDSKALSIFFLYTQYINCILLDFRSDLAGAVFGPRIISWDLRGAR